MNEFRDVEIHLEIYLHKNRTRVPISKLAWGNLGQQLLFPPHPLFAQPFPYVVAYKANYGRKFYINLNLIIRSQWGSFKELDNIRHC